MAAKRLKVRKVAVHPAPNPVPKLREYRVRVRDRVYRVPAHSAMEAKHIGMRADAKRNPQPTSHSRSIPIVENGQVVEVRTFRGRTQEEVDQRVRLAAEHDARLRAALQRVVPVTGFAA
jgi:hypothetical protein